MQGQGKSSVEDKLSEGLRTVLQKVVTACDQQFERVAHSQAALATRLDTLESKLKKFQANVSRASLKSGEGGAKAPTSDATMFQEYATKVSAIRGRVDAVNRHVESMKKRVEAVEDIVKTKRSLAEAVIASEVVATERSGGREDTPEEEVGVQGPKEVKKKEVQN